MLTFAAITNQTDNMDGIMTWMKENYDLLTLLVAVVGVVVSCIAVVYETRKKKQSKKKQ